MKRYFVFLFVVSVKIISRIFFRFEITWVDDRPLDDWKQVKVFACLNHTSLFEPLFLSAMPFHFLWHGSKHALLPIADKTMDRPILGKVLQFMAPDVVSITRRKDETWDGFLHKMSDQTVVCLAPEGRMMRANGLDSNGKPMSVRGGISDILLHIHEGYFLFGYSGGLHHIQKPGEKFPKLFKTIRIRWEAVPIAEFKRDMPTENAREFKVAVVKNLNERMLRHSPISEGSVGPQSSILTSLRDETKCQT